MWPVSGMGERDLEQAHLLELPVGSLAPLLPLKPLVTLTYMKTWSPGSWGHQYLTLLNLPPSFLQKHCLFVTEDFKGCISPGKVKLWGCGISKEKAGRGGGGFHFSWCLCTWWHDMLTNSGDGHIDQELRCAAGKIVAIFVWFYYFVSW